MFLFLCTECLRTSLPPPNIWLSVMSLQATKLTEACCCPSVGFQKLSNQKKFL